MKAKTKSEKARILRRLFAGETYGVVAEKEGVSKSTVKKVFDEFVSMATDSSLEEAAEEYDAQDEIAILRGLAKDSKRADISLPELLAAARLSILMKKLELSPVDLKEHLTMYRKHKEKIGDFAQAAMKLSRLEKETGKTHRELITHHEKTAERVKKLGKDEQNLKSNIRNLAEEEKIATQKLEKLGRESERAQEILDMLEETKEELATYGLEPGNLAAVKDFLDKIHRLGGDAARAVKLLEENSSLEDNIKEKTRELGELALRLERMNQSYNELGTELKDVRSRISTLEQKRGNILLRLVGLDKKVDQREIRLQGLAAAVAQMLGVEADTVEMNKAINARKTELQNLVETISKNQKVSQDTLLEMQELEEKKQNLELEVKKVLGIKNYATELKTAINGLEEKNASLEKECAEKSARIALGETITNFLTRMPTTDFDKFASTVEWVKRIRDERNSSLKPLLPRTIERIRMTALGAFKGDLIHKEWHEAVVRREKKYRLKCSNLEEKLKTRDGELANVRKKNEFLRKLEVYVEGKQRSLKDLEDWTIYVFNKEVERRVKERTDSEAALVKGGIDWVAEKVAKKTQSS